jgi:BlaI family penicillinase repressor
MKQQISEAEYEIMKIIWENDGEIMFSQLMEILDEQKSLWKKNTVLTFLARLVDKKVLEIKKIGRRNKYIALQTEKEYMEQQTHDFLGRVYEGDAKGLISTLIQNNMVSEKDLKELETFWEKSEDQE